MCEYRSPFPSTMSAEYLQPTIAFIFVINEPMFSVLCFILENALNIIVSHKYLNYPVKLLFWYRYHSV